jgi:hypothetical protein
MHDSQKKTFWRLLDSTYLLKASCVKKSVDFVMQVMQPVHNRSPAVAAGLTGGDAGYASRQKKHFRPLSIANRFLPMACAQKTAFLVMQLIHRRA